LFSVAVAALVSAYQLCSLFQDRRGLAPFMAAMRDFINEHFERFGVSVMALFAVGWLASVAATRWGPVPSRNRRADRHEV